MISHNMIVEAFPYLTITPIIGYSGYKSISEVHLQLNANSASIQSHLGYGTLDLLFLTVLPAVHNTISLIPFIPLVNPGPESIIPVSITGPQIADTRLQFVNSTKLYKQYDTTENALKQLLLSAVDDMMFVRSLRNRHIGYANVAKSQIINHLYILYAKNRPSDLEENDKRMKTA